MGNSPLVRLSKVLQTTGEESWIARVRQNARAFFELRGPATLAAGVGGAFGLLEMRPTAGTRQRQAASLLVHVAVNGGLLMIGGQIPRTPPGKNSNGQGPFLLPPLERFLAGEKPSGTGKGGNHNLLPPSSGDLPRPSPIVLARPHVPDQREVILPVEPTVFDANATTSNQHVRELGLPWMKDRNLSNGPGGANTIGDKDGNTVGTSDFEGTGGETNTPGPYAPGMTPVKCVYCPDPEYTDEARHEKLQGSVTLRVLVTADGRAGQVRIVKSLGLGLDERAVDMVRKWRFDPARDASRKAIAEWVAVEATYRLF